MVFVLTVMNIQKYSLVVARTYIKFPSASEAETYTLYTG